MTQKSDSMSSRMSCGLAIFSSNGIDINSHVPYDSVSAAVGWLKRDEEMLTIRSVGAASIQRA